MDIETRGIIHVLSKQRTTNMLIRLRRCRGCSAHLFAYGKNRFSHDLAHIQQNKNDFLLDKLEFVLDAIQKNLYFPEKQIRCVSDDDLRENFPYFSVKTFVVGTH